jgi:hypothetical protein
LAKGIKEKERGEWGKDGISGILPKIIKISVIS